MCYQKKKNTKSQDKAELWLGTLYRRLYRGLKNGSWVWEKSISITFVS